MSKVLRFIVLLLGLTALSISLSGCIVAGGGDHGGWHHDDWHDSWHHR